MKATTLIMALFITIGANCYGDTIGAKAGYNLWKTAHNGEVHSIYAQIEHSIPLIPNIGVQASRIRDHEKLELTTYDAYVYYQLFDNSVLFIDLGLGVRRLEKGKLYSRPFSETLPMVIADVEFLAHSHVAFFTTLDVGKTQDTSFYDASAGIRLKVYAGFNLQIGYRVYHLDLNEDHIKNEKRIHGALIGLHIDI